MAEIITRREREKQEMKDVILRTAMNLFIEKGYDEVSIRNIADIIQYSPATVYNYFKDKDDILFTLHNVAFGRFYAALHESMDIKDPVDRLYDMGKRYISFALNNPEYYDLMFIMKAPMKKVENENDWIAGLSAYKLLEDTIKDCMDKGYIVSDNAHVPTYTMWSFVHGLVSLVIRKRTIMIPEEQVKGLLDGSHDLLFSILKLKKK